MRQIRTRGHGDTPTQRHGFTLIEVLATLLLIGIVMPVAMHGINLSLGAAASAKRQAEAATLAQARLDGLIATNDWTSASGEGDFAPEFPDYKWRLESTAREYDTTEIAITVTWQQQGGERSLTLATLISNAVISESGTTGVLP